MSVLHVSTSASPSSGKYIRKHTSAANSATDVRLQSYNTILLIKIIKNFTIKIH